MTNAMKSPETRRHFHPVALAIALCAMVSGCVDPPMQSTGYRTYGTATPSRPTSYQASTPSSKTVSSEKVAASAAVPQAKTSLSADTGRKGDLDDVIARIHARKADEAKAAEARKRGERDKWLVAHEGELAMVQSRLKSMRVFAATTPDAALKNRVRAAIAETEADIDALRSRLGDHSVGFEDASRLRSALEARHEKLASSSEEYRRIVGH